MNHESSNERFFRQEPDFESDLQRPQEDELRVLIHFPAALASGLPAELCASSPQHRPGRSSVRRQNLEGEVTARTEADAKARCAHAHPPRAAHTQRRTYGGSLSKCELAPLHHAAAHGRTLLGRVNAQFGPFCRSAGGVFPPRR